MAFDLGSCFLLSKRNTVISTDDIRLFLLQARAFPSFLCFSSVAKRVLVQNLSYENEFDLNQNELTNEFS